MPLAGPKAYATRDGQQHSQRQPDQPRPAQRKDARGDAKHEYNHPGQRQQRQPGGQRQQPNPTSNAAPWLH
ncbi:MAG: hypothetical protein IPM07_06380 [Anaerolineales bacterium]|nr:hypothetical protein [Anaerolineales bacterium]